jgi:3-deoxy-D-manno-octulosonate cytidylyltransferase
MHLSGISYVISENIFIQFLLGCLHTNTHLAVLKKIAIIPARYAATRFPGKLLELISDRPVIYHTWQRTIQSNLFDEVIVATDHPLIGDVISNSGGRFVLTSSEHQSGTDRLAEAITHSDAEMIVNVQGDEPFINVNNLSLLLQAFEGPEANKTLVASLMQPIDENAAGNPNTVKVITDKEGYALYFSRSVIPYNRDNSLVSYFKHIGVYAYRREALLSFTKWPVSALESAEKLEQLRYLENGVKIKMMLTLESTIGIDTPEDLQAARALFNQEKNE